MTSTFPIEQTTVDGIKYINMKSDVFHALFLEMMGYSELDRDIVNRVDQRFNKAKKIRKKRIKLKKEKQALIIMYNIIDSEFIKKGEIL